MVKVIARLRSNVQKEYYLVILKSWFEKLKEMFKLLYKEKIKRNLKENKLKKNDLKYKVRR